MQEEEKKHTIRLAGFTFDPLAERLDLPRGLRVEETPGGPTPIIVQFKKPLTREEQIHVQSAYGLSDRLVAELPTWKWLSPDTWRSSPGSLFAPARLPSGV